ncbi:MAG: 30S ribosomal protein S17 [Parcubacteria group bacterium GW2011_GWD2_43_10]|uniref:Small ribosomal subunit protein uS17 n=5 Tax=Candidatus Vebleniibacteriota TaxID=1817921 RepID=A0A1G2Q5L2_9BACT|nr:MAG: 30S ribosomal protein S17 [Parcubacteria group bacterium GW2011_GWA2_42_80]KKS78562.1 MAG: 30S ribosomal protein S17 [Parcubacteria group bacterium GW2011_GWD1_42_9]KKS83198.1 MAG: 30S ribosomal protein S17 [Parcubacteria group bacterium GW2011_GWD2_43_10]KKS92883.1 MAG: 30S ribosomal protein S17 [Parcubacteria group bacterium GW2011_GWE2_43_12]KKT13434.1 MAG: 30S ribosomal protein S17 [Parcubacteria group bacterium GW2011_GWA1_43_27]KKT14966.1 MAG: 30S ribosomal protein S17 [Parcubact
MTAKKSKIFHRSLRGVVVSAKADKTRVVEVRRVVAHAKYGKRFRLSRRFACHDDKNAYQLGDKVVIEECRPLSKTKKWRIISKISA